MLLGLHGRIHGMGCRSLGSLRHKSRRAKNRRIENYFEDGEAEFVSYSKRSQGSRGGYKSASSFSGSQGGSSPRALMEHQPPSMSFGPRCRDIKPRNSRQEQYVRLMNDCVPYILLATGPAGTGKTLLACQMGYVCPGKRTWLGGAGIWVGVRVREEGKGHRVGSG